MNETLRIAIATGGTAGHAVPAIAVGEELRASGAVVVFIGGDRAESELAPAAGFEFVQLELSGLDRRNPLKALRALWQAARGVLRARRELRDRRIDAVLAGGGYVAGPVGLAAVTRKIPLVVSEADAHLGVANRLLAPFAKRVCLAFPLSGREGEKYLVTGRPIAPRRPDLDRAAARRHFGLPEEGRCLLAFGGSLGARTINRAVLAAFDDGVPDGLCVMHLTGRTDFTTARELLDGSTALSDAAAHARFRLFDYTNDFDIALAAADMAICRAGGSVFELAASGMPALLVPYPHATADHQTKNANWYADGGAGEVLRDAELSGDHVRAVVDRWLADPQLLERMSRAATALARPDAAERIAAELREATGAPGAA